jgi:hypothetical protein
LEQRRNRIRHYLSSRGSILKLSNSSRPNKSAARASDALRSRKEGRRVSLDMPSHRLSSCVDAFTHWGELAAETAALSGRCQQIHA